MPVPHQDTFQHYDYVFEKRFGRALQQLTDLNLRAIQNLSPNKMGKIIDVGSGTGRLAIPLARLGYQVFAVDQCQGMNDILTAKANVERLNIPAYLTIPDANQSDADLVLAIFTVLAYVLQEGDLQKLFVEIFESMMKGGYFLFDLSQREPYVQIYNNGGVVSQRNEPDFREEVNVTFGLPNREHCLYTETVSGNNHGQEFDYTEEFTIRFWDINTTDRLLTESGFIRGNVPPWLRVHGTTYYLYQKPV